MPSYGTEFRDHTGCPLKASQEQLSVGKMVFVPQIQSKEQLVMGTAITKRGSDKAPAAPGSGERVK